MNKISINLNNRLFCITSISSNKMFETSKLVCLQSANEYTTERSGVVAGVPEGLWTRSLVYLLVYLTSAVFGTSVNCDNFS